MLLQLPPALPSYEPKQCLVTPVEYLEDGDCEGKHICGLLTPMREAKADSGLIVAKLQGFVIQLSHISLRAAFLLQHFQGMQDDVIAITQ